MPRKGKQHKADSQERFLELLAYGTLWNLTISVLFTNIELFLLGKADLLSPFKMLISMGFLYLLSYSSSNIYIHFREKGFKNLNLMCVRIISAIASVGTMFYALPSALGLRAWFSLTVSFDTPILLAFVVGIFAALVGLASTIRRMPKT